MAATVTYKYPVSGTTPPTTTQTGTNGAQMVIAQVVTADADTTATITHNLSLTVAENANLQPLINLVTLGAGTANATVVVTQGTNTVTLTFPATTGSARTLAVQILRPNSLIG